VPVCGLFLALDARLVRRWQQQVLAAWAEGQFDLDAFAEVLCSMRMVPRHTLGGMLGTLPTQRAIGRPARSVPAVGRRALAGRVYLVATGRCDRCVAAVLAYTAGLLSLALALAEGAWWPLAGLLAIPLLAGLPFGVGLLRLRAWRRQLDVLQEQGLEL